ncbi:MAG TPA: hypothetical protein VGN07_00370 [Steroidobacteraceae bacterium]
MTILAAGVHRASVAQARNPEFMGYELSYASNDSGSIRHINSVQEWNVKVVGGHVIQLQLAGFRRNGERNTFALKHLLMPSKKAGVSSDVKAERRLMHRIDAGGNKAENPHRGAKAMDPYAQTRGDKYGKAAKLNANKTTASNSVIDLSLINISSVLTKIAQACDTASGRIGKRIMWS